MKEKESIVKLVFGCINAVVSTTGNIHREIVKKTVGASESGFQEGGNIYMTQLRMRISSSNS